jgi:thioredoxin-related protein
MKKLILFCAALCFSFNLIAQEAPVSAPKAKIEWLSFEEAMEKMKTEKRKIFVDVYTDWCGWCKRMDATSFVDQSVVEYMNKKYYAVKFDAEGKDTLVFNGVPFFNPVPGSKRGTHTFAASLLDSRMSYPSFVILDENFTRLHVMAGYKKPEPLMGNLVFFGSNQHQQYNQYFYNQLVQQQQAQQQQTAQPAQKQQAP